MSYSGMFEDQILREALFFHFFAVAGSLFLEHPQQMWYKLYHFATLKPYVIILPMVLKTEP